ncbi:MAG: DNA translocase FtsK 4TM domain-containing protein, partial [Hansschlegelia sp.]
MSIRAIRPRPRGFQTASVLPDSVRAMLVRRATELGGVALVVLAGLAGAALATWSVQDPSFSHATDGPVHNLLGAPGAIVADMLTQSFGLAASAFVAPIGVWGWSLMTRRAVDRERLKVVCWPLAAILLAGLAGVVHAPSSWPLPTGLGGCVGDLFSMSLDALGLGGATGSLIAGGVFATLGFVAFALAIGLVAPSERAAISPRRDARQEPQAAAPRQAGRPAPAAPKPIEEYEEEDEDDRRLVSLGLLTHWALSARAAITRTLSRDREDGRPDERTLSRILARASDDDFEDAPRAPRREPALRDGGDVDLSGAPVAPSARRGQVESPANRVGAVPGALRPGRRAAREAQPDLLEQDSYELPPLALLAEPKKGSGPVLSQDALEQN